MNRPRAASLLRRHRTFWLLVAGVSAVGAVAAGIVYASIPDAVGLIHGCYNRTNGNLRVIDTTSSTCREHEQALSWSQAGPQGPQGPAGQQGTPGPPGVSGYQVVTVTDVAAPGQTVETAIPCPIGKSVLGGGVSGPLGVFLVHASYPGFGGWVAQVTNQEDSQQFFTVHAICAAVN